MIFILVDDLGWGDVGVLYQNDSTHVRTHKTPELDRMAAEGMQLRAHYCPAPVCAPSRASLLTGVHQGNALIRDNQFDKMLENNHTLATVMKQAGYATALIGKYGLQGGGSSAETWTGYPTKRGFDEFFGYVSHYDGHVHYPADNWALGDSEGHRTPKELWHNDQEVSAAYSKCYTSDLFTARAKHWIEEQVNDAKQTPFFLYLAYDTPHAALQIPPVAYPDGRGLKGGVRWIGDTGRMINTAQGEIDSFRHPDYVGRGWTDVEERFATMVRRLDDNVADLLQTLRDLNIDQNTMVVFTSDNGPHHEAYLEGQSYAPDSFQSYGPFEGTKRDTWEAGIRMPTLVWWPGKIDAGQVSETPSQFHDWMPTLATVAGIVPPARTDGVSLLPTLSGQGEQSPSTIYVEYWQNGSTESYEDFAPEKRQSKRGQMQVIHIGGLKGIRTDVLEHSNDFRIFDLKSDPAERHDLAGTSPELAALQQQMKDRVLQVRMPNATAVRPYDSEFVPAVKPVATSPGLIWSAYQGDFSFVPRLAEFQPLAQGDSTATDVAYAGATAFEFTGFVRAARDDVYTFVITAERGAFLRIHDAAVVDADFGYPSGEERSGTIRLKRGLHPIRLTCLADSAGASAVSLRWSPSGVAPRPFATHEIAH